MSEKTLLKKIPFQFSFLSFAGERALGVTNIYTRRSISIFLWVCFISFWATPALAQTFTVQNAKTELVEKVYRLDASLKYNFSTQALDALENGVTLILALDIEVIRPRRYMWDEEIAALEQRYEIQFLALTDQYLLINKNSGSQFVYSTLNEALATLETIDSLPIIDAHLLDSNEHYMVRVRSRLDFDSLPAPLRLKAYFSNDWWLTSGWYSRDLTGPKE
jgi:hypothetical protein